MKTITTNKTFNKAFIVFTLIFASLAATSCVFHWDDDDHRRCEYYIDGNYIRVGSKKGYIAFYIDGNYIRENSRYGDVVFYIAGNHVRDRSYYGRTVYYIDYDCIRDNSIYGETIFYMDGNYIYSYY